MIKIHEPDWLKSYADDERIKAPEVKRAFGLHITAITDDLINDGLIPQPMERQQRGDKRTNVHFWLVSEVRKNFIKD